MLSQPALHLYVTKRQDAAEPPLGCGLGSGLHLVQCTQPVLWRFLRPRTGWRARWASSCRGCMPARPPHSRSWSRTTCCCCRPPGTRRQGGTASKSHPVIHPAAPPAHRAMAFLPLLCRLKPLLPRLRLAARRHGGARRAGWWWLQVRRTQLDKECAELRDENEVLGRRVAALEALAVQASAAQVHRARQYLGSTQAVHRQPAACQCRHTAIPARTQQHTHHGLNISHMPTTHICRGRFNGAEGKAVARQNPSSLPPLN